jgi:hypothetical protein
MTRAPATLRPTVLAAICACLLALFAPSPGNACNSPANDPQEPGKNGILAGQNGKDAGENGHSDGCRARGAWYPEGAVIDLKALKGVQSLSVTPVLFVCRDGAWVGVSAEK